MAERISADQLNAFVTASLDVLERLARLSASVGSVRLQRWNMPSDALVILIGLEGDLCGQVVFEFDPPVIRQLIRVLLGADLSSLNDPLCRDALGEVANMIAGNTTGRLEALGLKTTITPPLVLTGEEAAMRIPKEEGVVIPIRSGEGEIGICTFLRRG
jgi:chemotaxis protein CheX